MFCPESQSISYKAICMWLLLVLGLEVSGRGQAVNQGWLLLVLGLGQVGARYRAYRSQMLLT